MKTSISQQRCTPWVTSDSLTKESQAKCNLCNAIHAKQSMQCNLRNAIYAMQSMQCNLCNAICAMRSMRCKLCNATYATHSMRCNLCNAIYAMQSIGRVTGDPPGLAPKSTLGAMQCNLRESLVTHSPLGQQ